MESSSVQPGNHEDALREAFARHTHSYLAEVAGCESGWVAARSYLAERGFDLRRWEDMPIGVFPNADVLRERLLQDGFAAEEIRAAGILRDGRLPSRLVGPIRDWRGRIVSFWARSPRDEGAKYLYLSRDWRAEAVVFGMDIALAAIAHGRHDLLLVEDLLDALLLRSQGLPAVAAIGASAREMSEGRWERLAESGVHRVTLAANRTGACSQAVLAAIECAARARIAPAVYVLPPEVLPQGAGPASVVRSLGPEVLIDLLARQRVHGFRYKALCISTGHKQGGPWAPSAQRDALRAAAEFYTSANQRSVPQLDAFFLPALLDELGLGWSEVRDCGQAAWAEEPPEDATELDPAESSAAAAEEAKPAEQPDEAASVSPLPEAPVTDETGGAEQASPHASAGEASTVMAVDQATRAGAGTENGRPRSAPVMDFCEFHRCSRSICLCWD